MAINGLACRVSGIVTYSDGSVGSFEANHNGKVAYSGSATEGQHGLEAFVGEKSPLVVDSSEFVLQDNSTSLPNKTPVVSGDEYILLTSLASGDDPAKGTVTDYVLHISGTVSNSDGTWGSFGYVYTYGGGVADANGGAIADTGSGAQIVALIGGTAAYLTRFHTALDAAVGLIYGSGADHLTIATA